MNSRNQKLVLMSAFSLLVGLMQASAQTPAPTITAKPIIAPEREMRSTTMPPQGQDSIGYKDVQAAYDALEKKPGVKITVKDGGWTIIEDRANYDIWSFSPAGHPAYPAVVKRTITEVAGVIHIDMKAICQAKKPACDKLIADFEADNQRMRDAVTKKSPVSAIKGKP